MVHITNHIVMNQMSYSVVTGIMLQVEEAEGCFANTTEHSS